MPTTWDPPLLLLPEFSGGEKGIEQGKARDVDEPAAPRAHEGIKRGRGRRKDLREVWLVLPPHGVGPGS